ncbi:myopalladin isoform X2 [Gouania willdenowi]|uniref:Myopalladin n=1 Tax=Gouania willdenowi TaxID=441366 RepID=A0A8C5I544_GOUWI|nr:myopalladin-like isoform X2 [Gouania willdenowi]
MQENSIEQPPSLSQLLRESYLAEARAQQRHSEMSRSDVSSSRLQIFGSLKGKAEDSMGHNDPQFPDLSAFLSQEELDKSVNLARLAIGHEPREERVETKTSISPMNPSSSVSPSSESVNPFSKPASAASITFSQPVPEMKDLPAAAHTAVTFDRKIHKTSTQQENTIKNNRDSNEGFHDCNQSMRNTPYGPETQSKKEFLNKAADFIEELSSLFKANSSKRVRPRTCKTHRSRTQSKSQDDGSSYPLSGDSRERTLSPLEVQEERPDAALSPTAVMQLHPETGHTETQVQDSRITEYASEERNESFTSTETPYSGDPTREPPHFIQKLKSREVLEGSKVRLDCIVRGLPTPEVQWFCESKELENSPDIQILANGELHSLIIAEAFEEDTGRYSCFASNFYGTDSTSAEIYVEGASSSDSETEQNFEHIAEPQRKQPKSSLSSPLSKAPPAEEDCSVSQPEEPSSAPLEPTATIQTSTATLPVSELSNAPTEEELPELDAQRFSSSSEDTELSESVSTFTALSSLLPIYSAPAQTPQSENQLSNHTVPHGLNGTPIMAAPVFTKDLQDLIASNGQLVVLECRMKGIPSPAVFWYKEGKVIKDSPEFRILQKKEICTLVIAEVFPEDSGTFTCTASNTYGSVSSTATLNVKCNGTINNHVRPSNTLPVELNQVTDFTTAPAALNPQPEVPVTSTIKPHSSTIRLDPLVSSALRLDPLNTSTLHLEPSSSVMLRPGPAHTGLPSLDPPCSTSSSCLNMCSTSVPHLDPVALHQVPPGSNGDDLEPQSSRRSLSYPRPFVSSSSKVESQTEQEVSRPSENSPDTSQKPKSSFNHQNESHITVPLPDPPPNSCLKTTTLTNHRDSRSSNRLGLRVHFKLPEDEEDEQNDAWSHSDEDDLASANKEPPPLLAKPKLDPAQLQLLHNQVLLEQQQENEPQIQSAPNPPFQIQTTPETPGPSEGPLWSPRIHQEPQVPSFQSHFNTMTSPQQIHPTPPQPTPTAAPTSSLSMATPAISTYTPLITSAASPMSPPSSAPPVFKTSSLVTSPLAASHLTMSPSGTSIAPVTQANTIHASYLNLSPAVFAKPTPPKLSTVPTDTTPSPYEVTSPAPLLRSTHASLMNLTAISSTFSYTRPKDFIAAQCLSPVRSPSPTESPVPLLQELAAELNSSAASSPTLPPFSPPPRTFPTRVLMSPTSPPSLMSSPTLWSAPFHNSVSAFRAQSPPQAASPTSSTSTPSPIQNPVAFLSSVLPSLPPSQATNSMGLPKRAPLGLLKKAPKTRFQANEDVSGSKELLLQHIEKRLQLKNDSHLFAHQQKQSNEGKTASRPFGPNFAATVINYDEEYKVSNFEQRLMSEIEFRLERTPVEESDDEVQHDDVPTGKCIAPIFDKKLKNFRAMEGVPVTFSCKLVGIPVPKVYWFKDGKQILKKDIRYKKVREGDGTCSLHIESTTSDEDGNYTIMAANPQGRISCSGHLIVQTGPPRHRLTPIHSQRVRARIQEVEGEPTQERFFRPHFLQAPGDMMAHEGRLCRLDCKVSGLPNPELMWLVNGKPIYSDIYHRMLVRENGIHSLVIDPLTKKDSGTYTCIASNKAGQSSFNLELTVMEKERKHPPHFAEKLQNIGIPEGAPVRLECRVMGVPPPVIFWKKDNESIPRTKDRISMTQDGSGYVCLLIQPTRKDDAGWYTVSAKNEAGIVSCTSRLDIYAQWHQSIPAPMKKTPRAGSRYAALTGQGLDLKSIFPSSDSGPILFSSSPPEASLESEEL